MLDIKQKVSSRDKHVKARHIKLSQRQQLFLDGWPTLIKTIVQHLFHHQYQLKHHLMIRRGIIWTLNDKNCCFHHHHHHRHHLTGLSKRRIDSIIICAIIIIRVLSTGMGIISIIITIK